MRRARLARPRALAALLLASLGCQREPAPPPPSSILDGAEIRLLLVGDPFADVLQRLAPELGRRAGGTLHIERVGYEDVRRLTLRNARDEVSAFDVVAFDVLWTREYAAAQVLLPLDARLRAAAVDVSDFVPLPWRASASGGVQLGIPMQPHPELLFYRIDLLAEAGLDVPRTTTDVLTVARALHRPSEGRYGIGWNAQRGEPLGQQMAHFYGAFGQPLLDADGRPTLDGPRAVAAARYALALLAVSPPDILTMAWDQRVRRIADGSTALAYEWTARADTVETGPQSRVAGRIGYAPAPHGPDAPAVTPLGTWSLGIPANVGPRADRAFRFLVWLTSPETLGLLAREGQGGLPRLSLVADPALQRRHPHLVTVRRLSAEGQLADWMRPGVPRWPELAGVLGTVYHDMLLGKLGPEEAARRAQARAVALLGAP